MWRRRLGMIGLLCGIAVAAQAQILRLPAGACAEQGESADGFEAAWPSWPSRGSGGVAGSGVRSIAIPGCEALPAYAQRSYFWFVPEPAPAGPMPLVVALHGTAGSPANAYNGARIVRDRGSMPRAGTGSPWSRRWPAAAAAAGSRRSRPAMHPPTTT